MNTATSSNTNILQSQDPILGKPDFFLPFLAQVIDDEIVFYSLDRDFKFVFLSGSARKVLGMEPSEWVGRSLRDALSENARNYQTKDLESASPSIHAMKGTYEFDANSKGPTNLEYHQVRILQDHQVIGYGGVAYRPKLDPPGFFVEEHEIEPLRGKANSLTQVERQVIELVFEGRQNKSIASELHVAVRTVESRRSRAMVKLQVKSQTELIRLWTKVRSLPTIK